MATAGVVLVGCTAPPRLASVSRAEQTSQHVLFRNVSVFDGVEVLHHRDVLVTGAAIDSVSQAGTLVPPDGTLELSGAGRMLLPGLVDSHIHLFSAGEKAGPAPEPEAIAQAFLFAGVTSVLIAAGFDEADRLSAAEEERQAVIPHVFTAGPGLSAPGGHPIPLLRAMLPWPIEWLATRSIPTAATADEAQEAVARLIAEHHPDFVKIVYDDLPPGSAHLSREVLQAAIAEARSHGVRPIVHANTPLDVMEVIDAGGMLLMHVPQRGVLTDAQVARIVEANVPVVTTVRLLSASYSLAQGGPIPLEIRMFERTLLQPWLDDPRWGLAGFSEEIDQRHDEIAADTAANLRKLLAAGARLFVGTDSGVHGVFPGASLHREIILLTELGMPPLQALRAATSAPAAFLDPSGSFGRIAAGQRADLVLVRGDPTRNIEDLAEIEEVFIGGVRLERQEL